MKLCKKQFAVVKPEKEIIIHFMKSCYYDLKFPEMPWSMKSWKQGGNSNEPTKN